MGHSVGSCRAWCPERAGAPARHSARCGFLDDFQARVPELAQHHFTLFGVAHVGPEKVSARLQDANDLHSKSDPSIRSSADDSTLITASKAASRARKRLGVALAEVKVRNALVPRLAERYRVVGVVDSENRLRLKIPPRQRSCHRHVPTRPQGHCAPADRRRRPPADKAGSSNGLPRRQIAGSVAGEAGAVSLGVAVGHERPVGLGVTTGKKVIPASPDGALEAGEREIMGLNILASIVFQDNTNQAVFAAVSRSVSSRIISRAPFFERPARP